MDTKSAEFKHGMKARQSGLPVTKNPYPVYMCESHLLPNLMTIDAINWRWGWLIADACIADIG